MSTCPARLASLLKIAPGERPAGRGRAAGFLLAAGLAIGLAGGCTGDAPGPLGADLPQQPGFDTLLVPLTLDSVETYRRIAVVDTVHPLRRAQVLYVGRQGSEQSSILVRYDFSVFREAGWDTVDFTLANIKSVKLRLYGLKYYVSLPLPDGTTGAIRKRLVVNTLADTLDQSLYPGPEPAVGARLCSAEEWSGGEIILPLARSAFLSWVADGRHTGLKIAEGDSVGSQAGIIGYASKELALPASLLAPLDSATTVGPTLAIEFNDPARIVILSPIADISTFSALDPLPDTAADGLVVRCHLRSDPLVGFSLAGLPPGAVVNRAVLTVTLDSARSYGPAEAIVCCEALASSFPPDSTSFLLGNLPSRLKAAAGVLGVETYAKRRLRLDLTSTVQRWSNGVYGEPLLFALLPAEDFLTAYNSNTWAPDVFWQRFWFYGTAAADPNDRPRLLINYTPRPGTAGRQM
ncbi:MAG: hypothetical protein ACYDIE_12975 [Candidatus Krumholzibacteriia bacterium]